MLYIIIFSLIIAILLFLLLAPIKLSLNMEYKNYFFVKIKYLFISWDNSIKKKKKQASQKSSKKEESKITKAFKSDFIKTLSFFIKLISKVLKEINYILSKTRIKRLYLQIICAMENAALCAVYFGAVSSLIYPLLGILESKTKVSDGAFNLDIRPLYNSTESKLTFSINLRISPLFLLIAALRLYFEYKKTKKELMVEI